MDAAAFQYNTLDYSKRQIRLLQFDLGNCTKGMIRCTLQTVDAHDDLKYIALSYTWSPNHPCHSISLNGKEFTVGESLFNALHILLQIADGRLGHLYPNEDASQPGVSKKEISVFFWIDAICINQQNHGERGHQVDLMADIYADATTVIAWLGPSNDDSNLAINTIKDSVHSPQEARNALVSISTRKYWKRMWVAQEFVLPKKILVLCGRDGFWWDSAPGVKLCLAELNQDIFMLWEKRRKRKEAERHGGYLLPLDELIEDLRDRQCTDRRDKVYALIGLVHPPLEESERLHADYEITSEKLYYKVLCHLRQYYSCERWSHQWRRFRMNLRKSLDLTQNAKHEFLYDITDARLRYSAPFSRHSHAKGSLPDQVSRNFAKALCEQFSPGVEIRRRDVESKIEYFEAQFCTFPKSDDNCTWSVFQELLRSSCRLGLLNPESESSDAWSNPGKRLEMENDDDGVNDTKISMKEQAKATARTKLTKFQETTKKSDDAADRLWVADQGHEIFVDQSVRQGAAIDNQHQDHSIHLRLAATEGDIISERALPKGPSIENRDPDGWTLLHFAASEGKIPLVEQLLRNGANIEARDQRHITPLHLAANEGHATIVEVLLQRGADIESQDENSCTPLHLAANEGYGAVVELLLKRGARIKARDEDGWTALHFAANEGHEDVIDLLLLNRACIEARDQKDSTPLHLAANEGYEVIVAQLLRKGANIEAKGQNGWTPLHCAASKGFEAIVELLLQMGANIEAEDEDGWTPLHCAASKGHKTATELLLLNEASVGAQDENGWEAMHFAAHGGYEDLVELLLQRGAEIDSQQLDGSTPLDLAKIEGHKAVVEQLLQRGAKSGGLDADTSGSEE